MEHKRSGYSEKTGKRVWSTTVTIVSQSRYDGGPFEFGAEYEDGSLNKVIDSLIAIREMVPQEYRDAARCKIDSEGGYEGDHSACISVSYCRPETPEETAAREASDRSQTAQREAQERAAYEQLKRKFG